MASYARRFHVPANRQVPFAVEAGGRLSKQALEWLNDVHSAAFHNEGGGTCPSHHRRALERLQVALMTSVARAVRTPNTLASA